MGYLEVYKSWVNDIFFDEDTRKELGCITSEKEIEDRFYKELEFGTVDFEESWGLVQIV